MWSPPASANHALRSSLLHWAGLGQLNEAPENRRTAAEFIQQLEQGSFIEVQGYQWSSRLWHDSLEFKLPAQMSSENSCCEAYKKPVKIVKLGKEAAPLVKPHFGNDETKDFSWLYSSNYEWVASALALPMGEHNERGN